MRIKFGALGFDGGGNTQRTKACRTEKNTPQHEEVSEGEAGNEPPYLILRPSPPDQAHGVAIAGEVQSGAGDKRTHTSMVLRDELSAKLNDITTDWPGSRAAANFVAALENDHFMTGVGQM